MSKTAKATAINLLNFKTPQMRAFHITWISFFLCFFGWFGIAPLMAIVREELALTKSQVGSIMIASVAITIVARLIIGFLCDRIGPRLAYTGLLILGSIPVMLIGFSNNFETFLLFRLAIGIIGASFVITQFHTSIMFAPNVVGTANATTAGWGNLGGGVTQMVMPLVFSGFLALGFVESSAWRYSMIVPGVALLVMAFVYYRCTQDTPEGNYAELRAQGKLMVSKKAKRSFKEALKDTRVWALFLIYGACFGVELTINNIAAIYFSDYFSLDVTTAGLIAGLFGLMNLFARSLGGIFGDKFGVRYGLHARVYFLFAVLLLEGVFLVAFSQVGYLPLAIATMMLFSLFVQMSEGATFSVVPFINKKAIGSVSGIVGAGGNMGAVAAGFLFRSESLTYREALFFLGIAVIGISFASFGVRFNLADETEAEEVMTEVQTLLVGPVVLKK
jgi:NNP family nitrate/nitrite transporter-like MFS transporter